VRKLANQTKIGKIERVDLRETWPNEERDFTPWLVENIEVLSDSLYVPLSSAQREVGAGDFVVDIQAELEDGGAAVIEAQLTRSDHNHLGKLITYRAMLDARVAIWIVSDARAEHVRAVTWLNESSDADFYLVKVEAIRIGDSPPAPLFTLVVGPSEQAKKAGETRRGLAEREKKRLEFWRQLLDKAAEQTPLFATVSPRPGYWISAGAGRGGLRFSFVIYDQAAQVELYIDTGDRERNKRTFDALSSAKDEVNAAYGRALDWQRLEHARACRIRHRMEIGGWKDEDKWPEIQDTMIEAMIRLEKALRPHIDKLQV